LEAADEIGGPLHPKPTQGGGGQTRAEPFVAHHDHYPVSAGFVNAVRARRVEPPLQYVAVDNDRAWQVTVALALLDWPDVHDQRTRSHGNGQLVGRDTHGASPGLSQERVDCTCVDLFAH
jgi:hypothetical protein